MALVETPKPPRESSTAFYNPSGTSSSLNEKEKRREVERERYRILFPHFPRENPPSRTSLPPPSISLSVPLFPPTFSPYISHAAFLSRARAFFGLWSESQHPLDRSGLQSTSRTRHCRDLEEVTVIRKLVVDVACTTLLSFTVVCQS